MTGPDEYTFIAPQFFNFNHANTDDDRAEEYFNVDHESNSEYFTPMKLRRSMSMGSVLPGTVISFCDDDSTTMHTAENNEQGCSANSSHISTVSVLTESSADDVPVMDHVQPEVAAFNVPNSSNTSPRRARSRQRLDELAKPKPRTTQYKSSAEACLQFQKLTPQRFRRTTSVVRPPLRAHSADRQYSLAENNPHLKHVVRITVPHSPALATKTRSRPTTYLPAATREENELAEMKKLKIRAKPVPKSLLGPLKPAILECDRKQATVIQPFNLTAPTKTTAKPHDAEAEKKQEFHAKPVPQSLYIPKLVVVNVQSKVSTVKKPPTPQKPSKPAKKVQPISPAPVKYSRLHQLAAEMEKKREELLAKTVEVEKKGRIFRAKPMPKSLCNAVPVKLTRAHSRENIPPPNNKQRSNENLTEGFVFKAKPALVVHKSPFKPILDNKTTAFCQFDLSTERRAIDRAAFDEQSREREREYRETLRIRQLEQERLQKLETEEIRKQLVPKAMPIKQYKAVQKVPIKNITVPITPQVLRRMKASNESL